MKKLSNKILLIGLLALIAAFAGSRLFRSPALESNLRKELVTLDTATITEIRILPGKEHTEELKLVRDGNVWRVNKGQHSEPTNGASIKGMLSALTNLRAQRMATRKKEKWQDYNVGDNSTHVSVYHQGSKLADFHVGKLGFVQSGSGGFGGAYTYLRLDDENEVYTVEGFLESSFNNSFNDLRDKTFLKLDKNEIVRLSFQYVGDSSFVVEKRDSVWYIGNEKAEASRMEVLLNHIGSKYLVEFADDFTPTGAADASVQMNGKTGAMATVSGWRKNQNDWILTSTLQPRKYFTNKSSSVVSDLFVTRQKLLATPVNK